MSNLNELVLPGTLGLQDIIFPGTLGNCFRESSQQYSVQENANNCGYYGTHNAQKQVASASTFSLSTAMQALRANSTQPVAM